MRGLEKRLAALEGARDTVPTSFDHLPDDALDHVDRLFAKGMLNWTASDVGFFQQYGFLPTASIASGTLRDSLSREEVAYMEALGA